MTLVMFSWSDFPISAVKRIASVNLWNYWDGLEGVARPRISDKLGVVGGNSATG